MDSAVWLGIIMNRGRVFNIRPVWNRRLIFSIIPSAFCHKRLFGKATELFAQKNGQSRIIIHRVLNVPLRAGADYRGAVIRLLSVTAGAQSSFVLDLPTDQAEWGIADPMSSIARRNFRRGIVPSQNITLSHV